MLSSFLFRNAFAGEFLFLSATGCSISISVLYSKIRSGSDGCGRIPSLCVSAAPVVRQSVISERPWGGGSGFCGAHCLLSIYALGFCRFLVLFWPAAQPPSLSAQPPVSPGELTHSVNNPLYSSPDMLCCSFTFGYIFLSVQYLVGLYHL